MNRLASARRAYVRACLLVMFPILFAHEAAHAGAATLLGIRVHEFDVSVREGRPHVSLDVRGVAYWRVVVACLAPTIVGLAVAVVMLAVVGVPAASASTLVAGLCWLLFSWPSLDDARPLLAVLAS